MPDPNRFDETWSTEAGDPLDLGLVAAFGPDSGPPLPAGASVVEALRDILAVVPRVQLREPQFETLTPVHPPASSEMPADLNRLETPSGLQVHGLIARGGMGAILKGRDVDLGRDVAVKVLLETHKGRTELAQRFVEEAQIAGQLQHPGIVPVYELGVFPDRRPYFTMKLVKGQTLATLLAERGNAAASFQLAGGSRQVENLPPQPDLARFVGIFAQICQTVAYAHARGVIHRDLKPSNIMVGAFAEVQVMDWGLAKVLKQGGVIDDVKASREHKRPEEMTVICTERAGSATPDGLGSQTQAGSILGTPSFMAPEQARGDIELIDERADVFGLGAILCVILTGQPPFVGTTAEAQRKAQTAKLDDAFARLDNCAAEGDLIALAKSCLAAEPWDRPRNASEVADAVTAYQQSVTERLRKAELDRAAAEARVVEEARTRHMAEAKALEERKRRRATLAFATALLALVITGGGAAAWWWNQRTALVRDVEAALTEAATHQDAGRWPEVRVALERAEGRLGGGGPADLREKVRLARLDADTILELDEIRLKASEIRQGVFDKSGPATQYLAAFRKYGLTMPEMDVSEAVAKIRASPVSTPLLAALEDFRLSRGILGFITDKNGEAEVIASVTATGAIAEDGRIRVGNQIVAIGEGQDGPLVPFHGSAPGKRGTTVRLQVRHEGATESQVYTLTRGGKVGIWLEEVLTRADDNAWRKAFREAETAKNYEKMKVLATEPEVLTQPPAVIDRLAIALRDYGLRKETAALLRQAQQRYPNDFWINLNLGGVLSDVVQPPQLEEALGYLRVAVAVRPISAAAHNNLGRALMSKKEYEAAIHEYRESIRLDPNYAASHTNLAAALRAEAEKALGGMEKK